MIVRFGDTTFKISLFWFIPIVPLVIVEILLAEHYSLATATLEAREVRGVFHRISTGRDYTATINGREVFFDPSVFGAGTSAEATKIPNDTDISARVVDIKTMVGTVPFLVRAESKGTVFFEYSSHALRTSWSATTVLYSGLFAMIVASICFILGLTEVPGRSLRQSARPTARREGRRDGD